MLNYYGTERPEGGKIVDGVLIGHMPFIILYTKAEGAMFEVLGCADEATADKVMKRFEEQGDMANPRAYMSEVLPPIIKPYTMIKVEAKASKVWIPYQQ